MGVSRKSRGETPTVFLVCSFARPEQSRRVRFAAMDLGLQGRSAIVLGASQGMGLAIAEALAAEGANVAMFARRADVVEREAARIGALAVPGDLTGAADLERLVAATVEAFGGIDIVVLNGGGPPPGAATAVDARLRPRRGRAPPRPPRPARRRSACRTSGRAAADASSRSSRRP